MHPVYHPLFVKFIVYFNTNQDYFECHEVLEAYWKSFPKYSKEHPLTAFILLATGMYHWRRGNYVGAQKTLSKAIVKLQKLPATEPRYIEVFHYPQLLNELQQAFERVKLRQPFVPFSLHITSPSLQNDVFEAEKTMELLPANSNSVLHKHMLRHRSDIQRNK